MKRQVAKIVIAVLFIALTFIAVDFDLSWADTEETTEQSVVNVVAEEVEEEMEFLYIENSQLESPGTQNIAVAWDKDMINVTEFILIYSNGNGNAFEINESARAEKSVLFTKEFSPSEVGTYKINGIKYAVNGTEEEQYLDFKDLEIKADFEVVNKQNDSTVATVEPNVATTSTDVDILTGDVETLLSTANAEIASANKGNVIVVIDPGHGGDDPGACAYGLKEKDITLKISKYLRDELKEYSGVEVYMTRETDKHLETATASGITNRVNYAAGKEADILVSIHINAAGGKGAEVWAPNENYRSDIYKEGQGVSQEILDELVALGLYNRGVKESYSKNNTQYPDKSLADYYGIIRQSKEAGFTGIIVEHAFIDNASDAAFLSKEANLKKLGIADATGIANYYGLSKEPPVLVEVDGKVYCYAGSRQLVGEQTVEGKRYFFDLETGELYKGKEVEINGKWHYFKEDTGEMAIGWIELPEKRVYYGTDGAMRYGKQVISGKTYYFDRSTGELLYRGKEVKINGRWHYFKEDTGEMAIGWIELPEKRVYYGTDGAMCYGKQVISGKTYYFDRSTGELLYRGKEVKINGRWHYFKEDTGEMATGWTDLPNKRVYYNANGAMQYGKQVISGKTYYFDRSTGELLKGKEVKINGKWHYFKEDTGEMATGWIDLQDKRVYYGTDGTMRYGKQVIDGKVYYFNKSSGALEESNYRIEGKSNISINQLVRYYESKNKSYPSSIYASKGAEDIEQFCTIYYEEAMAEGIKVEVAFCQAMKETGWLQFGRDVDAEQCNFAGLGAVGNNSNGATFSDVREGVRAHIQHLKAYANNKTLNNSCVDPRFNLVTRGCAEYVEWLGQKENPNGKGWAAAKGYGLDIIKMINEI